MSLICKGKWDIRVYDIDAGIGTHILIDEGYVYPGSTAVSTDSHANILGAIGHSGREWEIWILLQPGTKERSGLKFLIR